MAKKKAIQLVDMPDERKASREAWEKLEIECADRLPPLYDLDDLPDDWHRHLLWGRSKPDQPLTVRPCLPNVITILGCDPRWSGVIVYDEFGEEVAITRDPPWHAFDAGGATVGPWSDEDTTRLCSWLLRAYGITVAPERADAAVSLVAKGQASHPVREYLDELTWDGTARVDGWLSQYLRVVDSPYVRAVGRSFLLSLVARVLHPACKVDTMLVLEGDQGVRKSTALRTLVGDEWYLEIVGGIDVKETPQQFRRKWLIEVGELSAMRRTDIETFKGFVSRTADNYRPPYAKRARDFRRQCVLAGTTNAHAYLHDETGGRRFLPVRVVGEIDIDALARDRAQLLAEAYQLVTAGAPWHISDRAVLDAAKVEQDDRYQEDPWHQQIAMWLYHADGDASLAEQRQTRGVTTGELMSDCLGLDASRQDRAAESRVGAVLRRLNWQVYRTREAGIRIRRYRAADVAAQPAAWANAQPGPTPGPTPPVGPPAGPEKSHNIYLSQPLELKEERKEVGHTGHENRKDPPSRTPNGLAQVGPGSQVHDFVDDFWANPPDED